MEVRPQTPQKTPPPLNPSPACSLTLCSPLLPLAPPLARSRTLLTRAHIAHMHRKPPNVRTAPPAPMTAYR